MGLFYDILTQIRFFSKVFRGLGNRYFTTPDDKGKLLPDNTLNSLGKMALGMLTHISLTQVLIRSELARTLPDKEALNEFIAFRRDYMNFPVDKQIEDLKRVGVVK